MSARHQCRVRLIRLTLSPSCDRWMVYVSNVKISSIYLCFMYVHPSHSEAFCNAFIFVSMFIRGSSFRESRGCLFKKRLMSEFTRRAAACTEASSSHEAIRISTAHLTVKRRGNSPIVTLLLLAV